MEQAQFDLLVDAVRSCSDVDSRDAHLARLADQPFRLKIALANSWHDQPKQIPSASVIDALNSPDKQLLLYHSFTAAKKADVAQDRREQVFIERLTKMEGPMSDRGPSYFLDWMARLKWWSFVGCALTVFCLLAMALVQLLK